MIGPSSQTPLPWVTLSGAAERERGKRSPPSPTLFFPSFGEQLFPLRYGWTTLFYVKHYFNIFLNSIILCWVSVTGYTGRETDPDIVIVSKHKESYVDFSNSCPTETKMEPAGDRWAWSNYAQNFWSYNVASRLYLHINFFSCCQINRQFLVSLTKDKITIKWRDKVTPCSRPTITWRETDKYPFPGTIFSCTKISDRKSCLRRRWRNLLCFTDVNLIDL